VVGLPVQLVLLVPLSLAAGIDLYLTLLILGSLPTLPWWGSPLPGALGDLDAPGIVLVVGALYLLEFTVDRFSFAAFVWNAFHAAIRPVAGGLLALMLFDGAGLPALLVAAVLGGTLSSLAHAVRSGAGVVRWLGATATPDPLLVSLLEDSVVLGLIVVALDTPRVALAISAGLLLLIAAAWRSNARAFLFAARLVSARFFQPFTRGRWVSPEDLPAWVRQSLEGDVLAPGGGLRGSPAGATGLPGAPRFSTGWVVVRGGSPLFVHRRGKGAHAIDLGALKGERIAYGGFFRRVDLRGADGTSASVFFAVTGPAEESLRSEFPLTS